jgi:hypothetical protein
MDVDRRMYCSLLHTMALLYLSIHKKVRYVVILDLVTIMKVQPDNFQRIHFTVLVVLDQLPDRGMTVIRTPASHQFNPVTNTFSGNCHTQTIDRNKDAK